MKAQSAANSHPPTTLGPAKSTHPTFANSLPLVVVSLAGGTDNIHAKAWSAVGNHPLAATVEQVCLVAVMAGTH